MMIETQGLQKRRGARQVLRGVSLRVAEGEVAAIVGPAGGGKSAFLRCLNGLESFDAGEIRIGDQRLLPGDDRAAPPALHRIRQRIGMVFQQFNLFSHLSALDNVALAPRHVLRLPRDEALARARTLLIRVGLADKLDALPGQLTPGQQQRVGIARALAMRPRAILFDEPTGALDPRMAAEVLAVLADLAASGQTMLVVTSSLSFVRRAARRVHVFHEGAVIESGPPEQLFDDPRQTASADFLRERN